MNPPPSGVLPMVEPDEQTKRKSNEVAGFKYVYWKQVLVSIFTTVAFLLLLPLWPVLTAIQTRNSKYVRQYFKTLFFYLKLVPTYITHGTLLRTVRYNFFMTPREVSERIAARRGACTRCGKCCNQFGCIFLGKDDDDNNICTAYGTLFWYYGTCGRYPLSQKDIDDHACPGFSFVADDGRVLYEV